MNGTKFAGLRAQRGLSLSGLMAVLAILGLIAVLAMKIFPTFLEYRSARTGIISAKATNGTPGQMKEAFDKTADINAVTVITGKDLIISKDTGEVHVAFSYDKDIALLDNVKLVIHYQATTDPTGRIPEKPVEPTR